MLQLPAKISIASCSENFGITSKILGVKQDITKLSTPLAKECAGASREWPRNLDPNCYLHWKFLVDPDPAIFFSSAPSPDCCHSLVCFYIHSLHFNRNVPSHLIPVAAPAPRFKFVHIFPWPRSEVFSCITSQFSHPTSLDRLTIVLAGTICKQGKGGLVTAFAGT